MSANGCTFVLMVMISFSLVPSQREEGTATIDTTAVPITTVVLSVNCQQGMTRVKADDQSSSYNRRRRRR
jgi:uncharacterized membrane protein